MKTIDSLIIICIFVTKKWFFWLLLNIDQCLSEEGQDLPSIITDLGEQDTTLTLNIINVSNIGGQDLFLWEKQLADKW